MGGLKTYVLGLIFWAVAGVGQAMPLEIGDQARSFAACLGRYSATMEHEWLMGRDGALAQDRRRLFESLLDAVTHDARTAGLTGAHLLHIRIEAKFAQARLLQTASLGQDARRARYAQSRASQLIGTCQAMVLG
ncbi:hypothetical protein [Tropicibacter oceani]|uniref:Uncharacterized protein n=1 Tax=Tropicibacter oceani TaxID=3058420 RepID=A0ABY8QF97_9RHOB|nr:hypothetical protein [Tropicibacter oceani]WGW03290.1 hypothetical protein QF118_15355 [Tropicibacter oceani]